MDEVARFGSLNIDRLYGSVFIDGRLVYLTMTDYRLLLLLAARRGEWVSTQQIIDCLWAGCADESIVSTRINYLRQKLGDDPRRPRFVLTKEGRGYKLIEGKAQP